VALYGKVRGSVLFGSAHAVEFTTEPQSSFGVFNTQLADHRDRVLGVAEAELGLEVSRCVANTLVFGQLGLVGQDWISAGNANSVAGSDLGFFGAAFRLGVQY
jgi:hypothetical protein